MNTGRIFDISRGCVDDGPGYRTVVFLKGCDLDCPWCHNPEGKTPDAQIAFDAARCLGCGVCWEACTRTWEKGRSWRIGCTACGQCAVVCPSGARRLVGCTLSVDELVAEVERDNDFFKGTGGGVTLSGGEPLLQPEFLFTSAEALRSKGIHVALETSGHWPGNLTSKVSTSFDLILFDLKQTDHQKFRQILRQDLGPIQENLAAILSTTTPVEIRLTLIPGFNDTIADLLSIAQYLKSLPRRVPVRLQPFHRLAVAKQRLFDIDWDYASAEPTNRQTLSAAAELLSNEGIVVTHELPRNVG